jgi:4-hydroxythreonine-4-phosphate dehydrogenase
MTTDAAHWIGRGGRRAVIVTQGDPEGIGPELIVRLAVEGELRAPDVIVADPEVLRATARALPEPVGPRELDALLDLVEPITGRDAGDSQVRALERGTDLVRARADHALVTAPIDKDRCATAGFAYPGHTEYLAARSGGVDVAMVLVGPRLVVGLVTLHLPLREVAAAIDRARVVAKGRLLAHALAVDLGVVAPRIGVLGLNPHAGERGRIGREEIEIIEPAVRELAAAAPHGATFVGPLPADAAFPAHFEGHYDGLLAMYHDQGLGPFKLVHFRDGVNLTAGLPFRRTSPDHGTARDIAGRGIADPSSMRAAIRLARRGPA